jgi:uncharacterized membrane protein
MTPIELLVAFVALAVGVFLGYDAERWDRNVNGWSLAGVLFSAIALGVWLTVRHGEARRRRAEGTLLPLSPWRWLRSRRRDRSIAPD